jgi:pyrroline-5-carboxylate reductase
MILGFIGIGKIASSVITGICCSNIKYKQIFISSRNKKISSSLKKKFKKIIYQKQIKKLLINLIGFFYLLLPTVGEKIIKDLKFRIKSKSNKFHINNNFISIKKDD